MSITSKKLNQLAIKKRFPWLTREMIAARYAALKQRHEDGKLMSPEELKFIGDYESMALPLAQARPITRLIQ